MSLSSSLEIESLSGSQIDLDRLATLGVQLPPYWVSDPGLPGFPVDAGESELWFSYLHSVCFYPLSHFSSPRFKILCLILLFFIFNTALRRHCDLSISFRVEESYS